MKVGLVILFVSYWMIAFAQQNILPIQTPFYDNEYINGKAPVQPYRAEPVSINSIPDTSIIIEVKSHKFQNLRFYPLVESYATYDSVFNYRAAAGFGMTFNKKKWSNKTQFLTGWSNRESIIQEHAAFLPQNNNSYYWFNSIRTRTHYTPNKNLDLSFGIDNHFIGEGYRSLVLSNQGVPAPFAMMRVNFRKLEYGLLYQVNHENLNPGYLWKFNTLHYLSWQATRKFNLTLIEQVLFQEKDGSFNRGFEIEYLNPIVFFRPQEYSLGSSDNVVLGMQTSYTIGKHKLYGQMTLDEFVLGEIKKRSRWWANKYGFQLGIKGTVGKVNYLVEGNVVRPYTFSHINDGQNAGNLGLPVGHPLGSNFAEILSTAGINKTLRESRRNFTVLRMEAFAAFQLKGFDQDSMSWGGDIYQSYVNRPKEYGNTIGQGITVRSVIFGVRLGTGFSFIPIEPYFQVSGNYSWGDIKSAFTPTVLIGVRSKLFQGRRFL